MSNDAEVRARIECLLLDLLRAAAEPEDVADAVAGNWQRVEMSGEDAIALCLAFVAAEARSHDGEWEAMRERCAQAVENMPIQIYRDEGIGSAGRSCKPATFADAAERIRSLSAVPLFDEGAS